MTEVLRTPHHVPLPALQRLRLPDHPLAGRPVPAGGPHLVTTHYTVLQAAAEVPLIPQDDVYMTGLVRSWLGELSTTQ